MRSEGKCRQGKHSLSSKLTPAQRSTKNLAGRGPPATLGKDASGTPSPQQPERKAMLNPILRVCLSPLSSGRFYSKIMLDLAAFSDLQYHLLPGLHQAIRQCLVIVKRFTQLFHN